MNWFCCQRNDKTEEKECQLLQDKVSSLAKVSAIIDQNTRRSVKSNYNHQTNDHLIIIPSSKDENKIPKEIILNNDFNNINEQNKCFIYENYRNHPSPALPGLHCDLIDNNFFIGQKISNSLIQQYSLVKLFKAKQIGLIVNLQLPLENQNCQLKEEIDIYSGGSYTPAIFSSQGICVIQSGFKDRCIPESFEFALKIIREMAYTIQIEQKKVYLHSHFGLERTCLIMVCYKIFTENSTTESAYQLITKQRNGSFLNENQLMFCEKFEQGTYLKNQISLSIYPLSIDIDNSTLFIPKILRVCLSRILILHKKLNLSKMEIYHTLNGSYEKDDAIIKSTNDLISKLKASDYSLIEESESIMIITEVLFTWLNKSVQFLIEPSIIAQIFQVKVDNETIDTLIEKNIVSLSELKMKEIQSIIVNSLNKVESEIFKYVSWFISHLLPSIAEETQAYEQMIEKLSIYLIGYDPDMLIDDNDNLYYPHYRKLISQTISLLKLFISSEVFNEKNEGHHKSSYPFGVNMLYLTNINVSGIADNDKQSFLNSGKGMSVNEFRMYELYYSLKKRFEPNEIKKQGSKHSINSKLKKKVLNKSNTTNVTFSNTNVVYNG